jgi:hypothetical protein
MDSVMKKVLSAKDINHKGQGLWVSLQMLPGDLTQVREEYPHFVLGTTVIARKMGFPDVIMPGRFDSGHSSRPTIAIQTANNYTVASAHVLMSLQFFICHFSRRQICAAKHAIEVSGINYQSISLH